jgi:hypothetical protein
MSKKPSLAAQADPNTALIPDGIVATLDAATSTEIALADTGGSTPYVAFAYVKAKKWPEMSAAIPGLREDEPVLVRGSSYTRLAPFKFFLLSGHQHWAERARSDGTLLAASLTDPGRTDKRKEVVEAALLVFLPDGSVTPARCSFKSTKAPAAKAAVKARDEAGLPEWANRSPAHADTLRYPRPWMRFVTTVALTPRTVRTGENAGNTYTLANGVVTPTSRAEADALAKHLQDATQHGLVRDVLVAHDERVAEVVKMAGA